MHPDISILSNTLHPLNIDSALVTEFKCISLIRRSSFSSSQLQNISFAPVAFGASNSVMSTITSFFASFNIPFRFTTASMRAPLYNTFSRLLLPAPKSAPAPSTCFTLNPDRSNTLSALQPLKKLFTCFAFDKSHPFNIKPSSDLQLLNIFPISLSTLYQLVSWYSPLLSRVNFPFNPVIFHCEKSTVPVIDSQF